MHHTLGGAHLKVGVSYSVIDVTASKTSISVAVTAPVIAPQPNKAGTPTTLLSSYSPVAPNLLIRLYLVLPNYFVLFERVMPSEELCCCLCCALNLTAIWQIIESVGVSYKRTLQS